MSFKIHRSKVIWLNFRLSGVTSKNRLYQLCKNLMSSSQHCVSERSVHFFKVSQLPKKASTGPWYPKISGWSPPPVLIKVPHTSREKNTAQCAETKGINHTCRYMPRFRHRLKTTFWKYVPHKRQHLEVLISYQFLCRPRLLVHILLYLLSIWIRDLRRERPFNYLTASACLTLTGIVSPVPIYAYFNSFTKERLNLSSS